MRSVHALQSYVSPENYSRHETTKTKRTTGATDGPKSLKGFSLAIALRRQLTARRLAGCCRVDARFTLAFWTLAPWTLAFGHWSRRTLVAIGTGRFRRSSFSARDGARNPLDQPSIIQQPIR